MLQLHPNTVGNYVPMGDSILFVLPGEGPTLAGSRTRKETEAGAVGRQLLPGLIYDEDYYPLSPALRFGISMLEKKIPPQFQHCTRYMDFRNGGVVRWNSNFIDEKYSTTFSQTSQGWTAEFNMSSRTDARTLRSRTAESNSGTYVMDMNADSSIAKMMKTNTDVMALDAPEFLDCLLMMGICVTWLGCRLYEHGTGLLQAVCRNAGRNGELINLATLWDTIPKPMRLGQCTTAFTETAVSNIRDYAECVGLGRFVDSLRCTALVVPTRVIRAGRHWCAKHSLRLVGFETELPDLHPGTLSFEPPSLTHYANLASLQDNMITALGVTPGPMVQPLTIEEYVASKVPIQGFHN